MKDRDYQIEAKNAIKRDWSDGHNDVLFVAGVGAGKTNIFSSLLMELLQQHSTKRGLILAHRQELIDQPIDRMAKINPEYVFSPLDKPRIGVVMGSRNDVDRQLIVATIQTLASEKRLSALLSHGPIDYLVIDECHHATADTYVRVWQALKNANPEMKHLGVTATPIRSDRKGLVSVYQKVSANITIAHLVRRGYLVQPRWLGISTGISLEGVKSQAGDFVQGQLAKRLDTPQYRELIVNSYLQYAKDRKAIAFTASVEGAIELSKEFEKRGIVSVAVSGQTPKEERRALLDDFRNGRIQVVCNCQILTEGFDAPGTSCILMCRPTRSDGLYVQCMGRGLRPALGVAQPGEDCLILDFLPADVRNIVMAGDVLGLPKEVTRTVIKEQKEEELEPGLVQAGFTFDGEHFETSGTPLEIVARQLDYLNQSPFFWHRQDGMMTLGLGQGSDGLERILTIVPADEDEQYQLIGLIKNEKKWMRKLLMTSADMSELGEYGNEIASRWAVPVLANKGSAWQTRSISDGQIRFLRVLSQGEMKKQEIERLNMGEAAKLISYYQARNALERAL